MSKNFNVACRLAENAGRFPLSDAVVQSVGGGYKKITYLELETDSNCIAAAMNELGIGRGQRIALFVRYGIDFISLVFALLKTGATIVLIDPGMGIRRMLDCLTEIEPDGMVAIPAVHFVRKIMRHKFPKAKYNISVGNNFFLCNLTLNKIRHDKKHNNFTPAQTNADDTAAIIFTSGSTGAPKGVEFTHGIFNTQIDEIANGYGIVAGEVDLACFPLFGLFDLAMGVTAVIPEFDPTKPAQANPQKIIHTANDCKITQAFASPAIWNRVANYCDEANKTNNSSPRSDIPTFGIPTFSIPTLRRVISAGAPVSAEILQKLKPYIHPQGELFTPYGATESLPTASISATEILNETVNTTNSGGGVCVGKRFSSISWAIIEISDNPIENLDSAIKLPLGQIGELIVTGSQVTKKYINRPNANALAKITDNNGIIWHRMGDVGYLDAKDRFWFCGRKTHRGETPEGTLFTIPCESIFNQHPAVFRSALANSPQNKPRIFIEPHPKTFPKSNKEKINLINELLTIAQNNPITKQIKEIRIIKNFPVDVRHNVKINRELLATIK
jgi:acyl-CoA synthetase (AMP-forming)/AMP-acid ligase II